MLVMDWHAEDKLTIWNMHKKCTELYFEHLGGAKLFNNKLTIDTRNDIDVGRGLIVMGNLALTVAESQDAIKVSATFDVMSGSPMSCREQGKAQVTWVTISRYWSKLVNLNQMSRRHISYTALQGLQVHPRHSY